MEKSRSGIRECNNPDPEYTSRIRSTAAYTINAEKNDCMPTVTFGKPNQPDVK
jgi:hypothetical protein